MPVPLPPALVGSVFLARSSVSPSVRLSAAPTQLADTGLVQILGLPSLT